MKLAIRKYGDPALRAKGKRVAEIDDAIRELERACDERSSSLHFVGVAPEFVPLRSDRRFTSILKKIGLEPEKVFAVTGGAGRFA